MKRTLAFLALLMLVQVSVFAQVSAAPQLMNFQGRLAKPDGTHVPNGTYSLRFSLWDSLTGGTEKWNQTVATVNVHNGTFAVLLTVNTPKLFDADRWLEIKVGTDTPLTPRQQLVSVAFAIKANSVPDGSIGAAQIANGSLTADKFANSLFNSTAWLLGGNSGTSPASQFLGTTDNQSLVFRTNNTEWMRLLANGNLGLGTLTPAARLDIRGGETPIGAPAFIVGGLNGAQGQRAITGMYSTFMNIPEDTTARRTADIVAGFGGAAWGTEFLSFNVGNNGAPNDEAGLTSEKHRITSNGKLGVGTSTPTNMLSVAGSADFGGKVGVGTNTPGMSLEVTTPSYCGGSALGTASGTNRWAYLWSGKDFDPSFIWNTNSALRIGEEPTRGNGYAELMRISSNGNVGIGTTTPGAKLDVYGAVKMTGFQLSTGAGANQVLASDASGTGTWQTVATLLGAAGNIGIRGGPFSNVALTAWGTGLDYALYTVGRVSVNGSGIANVALTANANGMDFALDAEGKRLVNGDAYANFWFLNSDARFKKNVQPLDHALDTILNLRGVAYEWNDPKNGEGRQIGFIAQEVEQVLPEVVRARPDGYKVVAYQNIVPAVVESIKTLKAQIDDKQKQIETLRKDNDGKQQQMDDLKAKNEASKRAWRKGERTRSSPLAYGCGTPRRTGGEVT
jgi:hypothetical protein